MIDKDNAAHLAVNALKTKLDDIAKKSLYRDFFDDSLTEAQERMVRKCLMMAVRAMMT